VGVVPHFAALRHERRVIARVIAHRASRRCCTFPCNRGATACLNACGADTRRGIHRMGAQGARCKAGLFLTTDFVCGFPAKPTRISRRRWRWLSMCAQRRVHVRLLASRRHSRGEDGRATSA